MASPDSQETGLSGDSVSAGTDSSTHPGSDELRATAEAGTPAVAKVGTVSQPLNGQDLAAQHESLLIGARGRFVKGSAFARWDGLLLAHAINPTRMARMYCQYIRKRPPSRRQGSGWYAP